MPPAWPLSLRETGTGRGRPASPLRAARGLGLALLLGLTVPEATRAATGPTTPLTPPDTPTAAAYRAAAIEAGVNPRLRYLPPTSAFSNPVVPDGSTDPGRQSPPAQTPERATGWVLVLLILGGLAVLIWRNRKGMRELAGPAPLRERNRGEAAPDPGADLVDENLIARLQRETDPRVGLRLVLQRFLALAASDNAVTLKRSLTTRELMQRLPGSWTHRQALEQVARQTELVVFAGQEISRDAYEECLLLARPFLQRLDRR